MCLCYLACALFCSVLHVASFPTGSVTGAEHCACLMSLTCYDFISSFLLDFCVSTVVEYKVKLVCHLSDMNVFNC